MNRCLLRQDPQTFWKHFKPLAWRPNAVALGFYQFHSELQVLRGLSTWAQSMQGLLLVVTNRNLNYFNILFLPYSLILYVSSRSYEFFLFTKFKIFTKFDGQYFHGNPTCLGSCICSSWWQYLENIPAYSSTLYSTYRQVISLEWGVNDLTQNAILNTSIKHFQIYWPTFVSKGRHFVV